jgi:hypothetical protein
MPPRPRHTRLLPLSMTVRSDTGHELVLAARRQGGPDRPVELIIQTGMLRLVMPPEAAARMAVFMDGWWRSDP